MGDLRPMPLAFGSLSDDKFSPDLLKAIKETVSQTLPQYLIERPKHANPDHEPPFHAYGAWQPEEKEKHTDIAVVSRYPPGCPQLGRPTVLIDAEWNDKSSPHAWPMAVSQLHSALTQLASHLSEVDIELRAAFLARRCYVHPILDDQVLQDAWNTTMIHDVNGILEDDEATKGHVNAVCLSRFGFLNHPTANPITIFVAVAKASNEALWSRVIGKIKAYLTTIPRPIDVFVQHNEWDYSAFPLVTPRDQPEDRKFFEDYQKKVDLGADICGSIYPRSADGESFYPLVGTLGCYLKVKHKKKDIIMALTNYHVVRPLLEGFYLEFDEGWHQNKVAAEGTALRQADEQGIKVQTGESLPMEHPSRRRHNTILAQIQNEIDAEKKKKPMNAKRVEKIAALENERRTKQSFFDDGHHDFGRVWAASGFSRRTPDGQRLDWALIRVIPGRQGTNTLPDKDTWARFQVPSHDPKLSDLRLRGPNPESSIKTMENDTPSYKMGAASGPRMGLYSGFRQSAGISEATYLSPDKKTQEHQFLPSPTTPMLGLAVPGDSGAISYDEEGQVVGLIFRGMNPNSQSNLEAKAAGAKKDVREMLYTMVTPIEDVFRDIKLMTGATSVSVL